MDRSITSHSRWWLVGGLEMLFDCRVEAQSAEYAIHLFVKDVLQSILSLFVCRSGTCEVPVLCHSCNPAHDPFDCWGWGTKCRISSGYIAFIPFFVYLSTFPISFLPIGGSIPKHNFLFLSIYNFTLGYYQIYTLVFAPVFLESLLV